MRELPRTALRGAHNRVDPDYAPTVEVFDNLTHEQIHAGVSQLDPSALQTGGQLWRDAATGLNNAVAQAHTEIRGAISDGWRGSAAGSAGAVIRDFEVAGQQLADVLTTVGQRLSRAGDAAETVRAGIGAPSVTPPDLAAALLDPKIAAGNITAQQAGETERADAVRVMESVYLGAFVPTGSQVPAFPDLPDTTPGEPSAPTATAVPTETTTGVSSPAGKSPAPVSAAPGGAASAPGPADEPATEPAGDTSPARAGTPAVPAAAPGAAPAEQPAATTTAGTTQPAASAPTTTPPVTAPGGGTPMAPATASGGPVFAAPVRPAGTGSGSDSDRERGEEAPRQSSGESITGMGAGAIGGMMGGVMAADSVRSSAPMPPGRVERTDDEDDDEDDLYFDDGELTFLEEAEPGGQLIGAMDPTTPPVLGEWTEAE